MGLSVVWGVCLSGPRARFVGLDLVEGALDLDHVQLELGAGGVDHMQQQVGIGRFLQRFPSYRLTAAPERGGRARFRGFLHAPFAIA